MKTIDPGLLAHCQGYATTLATCLKIIRTDGMVQGFTSHSDNLTIDGVVYRADSGVVPSASSVDNTLSPNTVDLQATIDAVITEQDLVLGKYDNARLIAFLVNYDDLPPNLSSTKLIYLNTGYQGQLELTDRGYKLELRGLSDRLRQRTGIVTSELCRANLGDTTCKVDLSFYTVYGAVTYQADSKTLATADRMEVAGYFTGGGFLFLTGENAGWGSEVSGYSPGSLQLYEVPPYPVLPDDQYSVYAGCAKNIDNCQGKFANIINYQGEPYLPGTDKIMSGASGNTTGSVPPGGTGTPGGGGGGGGGGGIIINPGE